MSGIKQFRTNALNIQVMYHGMHRKININLNRAVVIFKARRSFSLWSEILHFLDIQDKGLQQNMRGNNKMGMMLQNYVPMIGDVSQTKHCTSPYTRKHLMLNSFSYFFIDLGFLLCRMSSNAFQKKQLVTSSLRHWSIRFLMKMFCSLCWSFLWRVKKQVR